jgi:hypothetical protein
MPSLEDVPLALESVKRRDVDAVLTYTIPPGRGEDRPKQIVVCRSALLDFRLLAYLNFHICYHSIDTHSPILLFLFSILPYAYSMIVVRSRTARLETS